MLRLQDVASETLVITGAVGLPRATHLSIPGLTQDLNVDMLEPPVKAFLAS